MVRRGIRTRLIFSFLLLIVITLASLGSYILWFFYRHNLESLTANLLTQAQITEELLREHMGSARDKAMLDDKIKELGAKIDMRITIIDVDGTVLADSQENPSLMENHLSRPEVAAALTNDYGSSIRYSTTIGENFLYVAYPMRQDNEILGIVRVSTTLAHVKAGYSKIRSALLAAFFLTSLLAVILSLRLARRYTAPLEEIIDAAQKMGQGKLDERVYIRTGDEIELLAQTLNNLASNLEDKITEITAEKRKFELILQHMDNGVILLNRYGRVIMANKQAIETFGLTAKMLGQHNLQVVGNSQFDRTVLDVVLCQQPRLIELKTTLNNHKQVFQVFLAPIIGADQEVTGVLSVFHDITKLQELQERQAAFVANASHELATPLTSIKGFAETLLDGALAQPELAEKFVDIIYQEADRMQRLVKELLQLAKLEAHDYRQHIVIEPVPVKTLIASVIDKLSPQWQQKEQTVTLDRTAPDVTVMANHDWLKQVLVNLLENAIKYTPAAGSIFFSCRQDNNHAIITLTDTGIGIPSKDLPLIFDRFYRVDRARTRSAGGTGLGLAIVKFIIDMLGGTIEVDSKVNVGTTFTITLPLAEQ